MCDASESLRVSVLEFQGYNLQPGSCGASRNCRSKPAAKTYLSDFP